MLCVGSYGRTAAATIGRWSCESRETDFFATWSAQSWARSPKSAAAGLPGHLAGEQGEVEVMLEAQAPGPFADEDPRGAADDRVEHREPESRRIADVAGPSLFAGAEGQRCARSQLGQVADPTRIEELRRQFQSGARRVLALFCLLVSCERSLSN